jgi:hypothetical protein
VAFGLQSSRQLDEPLKRIGGLARHQHGQKTHAIGFDVQTSHALAQQVRSLPHQIGQLLHGADPVMRP